MSSKLIVGTEECPIELVKEILCSPSNFEYMSYKWTDIAERLSLPQLQIKPSGWKQEDFNSLEKMKKLIMESIGIWVKKEGRNAFLEKLAWALSCSGLTNVADDLYTKVLHRSQSSSHTSDSPGSSSNPKGTLSEPTTESNMEDLLPDSFKIRESGDFAHLSTRPVIVGTPDCYIEEISTILYRSRWSDILRLKWTNIALDLGLDLTEIETWKQNIFELKSIIYTMLSSGVKLKGGSATLLNLLLVLRKNKMEDLARELESKMFIHFFDGQEEYKIFAVYLMEVKVISELEEDCKDVFQNINKVMYFPNQVLGTGFMGSVVFKGKLNNQLPVAVKRINESSKMYIENEIELLKKSKLDKNIGKLIGYEIQTGFYYLALELCNGNLKDWVEKTEKGMEVQGITDLEILSQSISALMYIHEKEIVHRNLKPSKIMLSKQTANIVFVKLFGFGLGTTISKGTYISIGPVGSPGWMAPEVFSSQEDHKINGANADIFSLGCLFYYAATRGGHPFGDKDGAFRRQVNIQAGNIERERSTLYDSHGMTQLIKLMIDKTPSKRPSLSVIQSHPVFWDAGKVIRFFDAVYNQYCIIEDLLVKKLENELEHLGQKGYKLVFKTSWTGEPKLKKYHKNFEWTFDQTVCKLICAFRNCYMHKNDKDNPEDVRGTSEEDYVNDWLTCFPNLLICTWVVFHKLKFSREFEEFYNTEDLSFWEKFERFQLIKSDLKEIVTSEGKVIRSTVSTE